MPKIPPGVARGVRACYVPCGTQAVIRTSRQTLLLCKVTLMCLAALGCTTIPSDLVLESRTFFGIVSIEPSTAASTDQLNVRQLDVTNIGLRVSPGIGIGYMRDQTLSVPLECSLVIFIRSPLQLENAIQVLQRVPKENVCMASTLD
jgi:hypothetical protein